MTKKAGDYLKMSLTFLLLIEHELCYNKADLTGKEAFFFNVEC